MNRPKTYGSNFNLVLAGDQNSVDNASQITPPVDVVVYNEPFTPKTWQLFRAFGDRQELGGLVLDLTIPRACHWSLSIAPVV